MISRANASKRPREIPPALLARKVNPFFSTSTKETRTRTRNTPRVRAMSTRECTYKYLSAGTTVRAAAPLVILTRARVAFFFLPLVWNQLCNGFTAKEKKFFRRCYGRCRINLYSRRNPVVTLCSVNSRRIYGK